MDTETTAAGSARVHVQQECQRLQDQLQRLATDIPGLEPDGVAREFVGLLTVVLGNSALLDEPAPATDRRRDHARDMLDAAAKAGHLRAQLLTGGSGTRPEMAAIEINDVLRELRSTLARAVGERVDLRLSLSAGVDPVRVDRAELEQVLLHLVRNAADAMPGGGPLTIETRFVTLTAPVTQRGASLAPGRYAVLAVSDTGRGMTADTRNGLFALPAQARVAGSGPRAGLATCDAIIRDAGGLIFVDSELGAGSVFTVLLPAAPVSGAPAAPPEDLHGRETILILEDSVGVRTVVRRMLEGFGYRVHEAATAQEALAQAEAHGAQLDLMLSDVILPDVSGAEVVRQIQARVPQIKAMFMSGHTTQTLNREHRLPDGAAFIQKPFERVAFARQLREVLDA